MGHYFTSLILFSLLFISIFSSTVYPSIWTAEELAQYTQDKYLNPNNPNYNKNIKYMIVDPENYVKNKDLSKAISYLKDLSKKYKISTHVFLISQIRDKFKMEESYAAFASTLSFFIYKNNKKYDEQNTITALFCLQDRKMRIRTSRELRKVISDDDASEILDSLKSYLRQQDYVGTLNNFAKKLLLKYEQNLTMMDNTMNYALIFTVILLVGAAFYFIILSKPEKDSNEDKIESFLDKLKNKKNPKEIFAESCAICLNDFKSESEIKELEKLENKTLFANEDISVLNCGHKFHRKCIADWLKKEENCPLCRTKCDIKNTNANANRSKINYTSNIDFAGILLDILRIQASLNNINQSSLNRIRSHYIPNNFGNNNSHSDNSEKKNESAFNKDTGGKTAGW